VAEIRQVGKGEGMVYRCDQEEGAAGGDLPYLGTMSPQEESGEREDRQLADDG
jgi:hypothetical protein